MGNLCKTITKGGGEIRNHVKFSRSATCYEFGSYLLESFNCEQEGGIKIIEEGGVTVIQSDLF